MIDRKSKLTSRKFRLAVVAFVTPIVVALGGSSETVTEVTALIMSSAAVVAYIIGEGLTDTANVDKNKEDSDNGNIIKTR